MLVPLSYKTQYNGDCNTFNMPDIFVVISSFSDNGTPLQLLKDNGYNSEFRDIKILINKLKEL